MKTLHNPDIEHAEKYFKFYLSGCGYHNYVGKETFMEVVGKHLAKRLIRDAFFMKTYSKTFIDSLVRVQERCGALLDTLAEDDPDVLRLQSIVGTIEDFLENRCRLDPLPR